ncbi:MAG: hypothetical protein ABH806_02570 [Candidatus Omnitrophota bacterium]
MTPKIKKLLQNTTLIAISTVFVFAALEAFLRLFYANHPLTPGTYISHETRRYAFRPGFRGKTYGRPYRINSFGLRDHEYSLLKPKGTFRILAVGDSCTFDIGLDLEDTYPKQLERSLRKRYLGNSIEVINCGIPSYNTACEYLFLKEEGLKLDPDLVIIGYVYNDSVYNYPLTTSKSPFVNLAKDILRWLYSYEFILDKLYKLNYILRGLAANDPGIRRENLQYVYSDRYIGWLKNKEAFSELEALSKEKSIPIVYVIYPKFEKLKSGYPYGFYHERVEEALKREPYVFDLLPVFKRNNAEDLWVNSSDSHPNRDANGRIVESISGFLSDKGLISHKAGQKE